MKKANTIISLLLVSSMFAAATSDLVLNKGLTSNGSKLALNCAEEVYGIQFDMHFNPSEVDIENLGSLVPGASLHISEPKSNDGGHVRVLMFSMDLDRLSKSNELSDIIDFEASLIAGDASITLDNIIVAGKNGEQVDNAKTVQLTFNEQQPQTTELSKIYPNPFNPSTTIEYSLDVTADVSMYIYDMQGRMVKTLVSNNQDAGTHQVVWNGINENGAQVSSGMYLVRMEANGQSYQQAITLLK